LKLQLLHTILTDEHNWFEWPYKWGVIIEDYTGLRFQNVAIGCINGVAALKGFSYKKMYPWAFQQDKKKWP